MKPSPDFFTVIWFLISAQEELEKKQSRKNISMELDCKLCDEWIALEEMINFLRTEHCKQFGFGKVFPKARSGK